MRSRTAPLPSERQLLNRAGGAASFKPGKGGAAGGDDRRKVGSGWKHVSTSNSRVATPNLRDKEEKIKVEIDDYEDDDEPEINPARLAASQPPSKQPRKPSSSVTTSRWATPAPATTVATRTTMKPSLQPQSQPPIRPTPISRTSSSSHAASASRQPKGPPSPSTSLAGTPRSSQTGTSRYASAQGVPAGGGTGTSRWATALAAQAKKDLPPHAVAKSAPPISSTSQPTKPPTINGHSTVTSPHLDPVPKPIPAPVPTRPEPVADQKKEISPSAQLPPPVPIVKAATPPPPPPPSQPSLPKPEPIPPPSVVQTPVAVSSPSAHPPAQAQQKPTPVQQQTAKAAAPAPVSKPVAPANGLSSNSLLNPRSLFTDRNRVASGGARKEKKSPEELEALMASMRLKNEEAMKKRAKAEDDRKKFEEIAEQERKRSEELERKLQEERERIVREEKERKERTIELQKEINRAREEAAQRKLALIEGRAWDAEKIQRERDPYGEGGSGRELQYPSAERRPRYDHQEEADEVEGAGDRAEGEWRREVVDEEERRRRDGVRNDEQKWETVEHFEGKGRAQLVVK